ncbi:MAG: bifunctional [glutamine synthetase] adenylyltransferase/[glutamine synthetase]-adenylyl-L-tyrosine phosphorylase [Arcanobacterium sp.]|nr:bifunctional [glutamine synthetase] adenylyltransferase/[glutamine synthetase]-adenylyl-L-tyrosine phosphorylase [Arcanobacterium sp.]
MNRSESLSSLLLRAGVMDVARTERLLADPVLDSVDKAWLIEQISHTADPDQAALGYIRLLEAATRAGRNATDALYETCRTQDSTRRLFAILGMSSTLTEHLISYPANVHILQDHKIGSHPLDTTLSEEQASALAAIHAELMDVGGTVFPVATLVPEQAIAAMRLHYWYRITQVAACDLVSARATDIMPRVSAAISDIVGGALESALAIAREAVHDSAKVGLAIIAMGKTGARELNYISDVDVVYVARSFDPQLSEPTMLEIATQLATFVSGAVGKSTDVPRLWDLDVNLRPEGKDGPLVRTLDSHLAYYKRWAKDWEFQALLKARPIAGDMELGQQYVDAMAPMVWAAAGRENFVDDSRAMRRRVEDLVPKKDQDRQLKLGKGGLRDVEFTVQLLQLVHGRTDTTLRVRNTLDGLQALSTRSYVSRKNAELLDADYRFLRTLEHRIQLQRFKRSHLVPSGQAELRRIARSMGGEALTSSEDLEKRWRHVKDEVRRLHMEIYYRPLLPEVAKLSVDDIALDENAARERLAAMGYRDPRGALHHIHALTEGVSRTAAIQQHLLPVMLGWFADGPDPDFGLKSFRVLSERMGHTSWYMRTLRDSGSVAERLAQLLSTSRFIADQLPLLPEAISWLEDDHDLEPRSASTLRHELDSMLSRRSEPGEIADAGRFIRRKELLRAALASALGVGELDAVLRAISDAGDIAIAAALEGARRAAHSEFGIERDVADIAVIAMGRFGGRELSFASDADVLFVHSVHPGVDLELGERFAIFVAQKVIQLLSAAESEPVFEVDAALRPEGKNGPLSRSIDSYAEYYSRWVETWERQALLRARMVCGDDALAERFMELICPIRYPDGGLSDERVREIRMMKARVERERMPRGIDPSRHVKLGRGGLSDVEWCVQLLQLEHAGDTPLLRVTGTLDAIGALVRAGMISNDDAGVLSQAWSGASRLRNLNVLASGRFTSSKVDVLPHASDDLAAVASMMGVDTGHPHEVVERYLRIARQARSVVERVFYGL